MHVQLLLRGPGSQTPGGDVMWEMEILELSRREVEGPYVPGSFDCCCLLILQLGVQRESIKQKK